MRTADEVCTACGPGGDATIGIVHIGDDTLARGHLATYAEDLIRSGWPGHLHLVRLDDHDDHLSTQDHLYTLSVTAADGTCTTSVVASIAKVSRGVDAAIGAIASPATRMVTVTAHEPDSHHDEDDWLLALDGASVTDGPHDRTANPHSIAEILARGLAARDRTAPPPVVVALDDVFMNGEVLRAKVIEAASLIDEELEEWIEIEVEFPNNVADRMVRKASGPELDRVESRLGYRDEAALSTERHRAWAIESVEGLPPLFDVGVELTRNIIPYERRRLWLLEGPRLALGHIGMLLGLETIADAAAHPVAAAFAGRVSRAAVAVMLMAAGGEAADGGDPVTEQYAIDALSRLSDRTVTSTCEEVCYHGSRNIPRTILPVTDGLLIAGLGVRDHALLVASWLVMATGTEIGGHVPPAVDDPIAGYLYAAYSEGGPDELIAAAMTEMAARNLPGFAERVGAQLERLITLGAEAFEHPDGIDTDDAG